MKLSVASLAIALAAAAGFAVACGDGNAPAPSTRGQQAALERPPAPPEYRGMEMPEGISAEDGKAIYTRDCTSCHGDSGDGNTPMGLALKASDLSKPELHAVMPDDYMFWRVSEGGAFPPFNSGMTPFKSLTEEQRWQVIAYVRSLKK
jgi:mono/diheme cytochrome c family protein